MVDWLLLVQLALTVALLGVISERASYLWYVAPASQPALSWLGKSVERGRAEHALSWARNRPRAHVAQILIVLFDPPEGDHDLTELLSELTERAVLRLRLLRVGATVASTTGLLIGIVRIGGGYAAPSGLLALEAGLTERLAMSSALFSMAVGVGTSAVCFYATSLFREAAQQLIAQSARAARLAKNAA